MLLLEGIGTIVFGLWVMSHGTGPGESIMIVLGLPIVLFGVVLTIVGFAKSLKEKEPDVSAAGLEQSQRKRGLVSTIEDDLSFADPVGREQPTREPKVREQRSRMKACPKCGAKYGLFDLVTQPTMCSQCWKEEQK